MDFIVFLDLKDKIKNCILRLLSFGSSNSKSLLIFNFFLFLFLFDVSKAENKDVNISGDNLNRIEYSSPRGEQEGYTPNLATNNPILEDGNKKNLQINIDYLEPKNALEDYILDTGDALSIKFIYVPEFNSIKSIDQEGEIFLPELGQVYLRGLTISQMKVLLQKKYSEYLKFPEMEIRIVVFKPQRILISGEVRNPGIYKFQRYSNSGEFFDDNQSNKREQELIKLSEQLIESNPEISASEVIGGDNLNKDRFKSNESNVSLNQNLQNNNIGQNFQIKRPSENYTTLSNAIRRAGGITSKTDLSRIEIIRDVPIGKGGGKKRAIVDFTSFLNRNDTSNDIRLFDGDRIFLPKLALSSPEIIPKSILSGLSPKFITVQIFGRVERTGSIKLPLEASLSDAIDLTGPIKPLSGKIVLIRYNKDGTILKENISYSSRARRGSKRNPYVKEGDLISVKNSLFGKSTGVLREITAPFIGIYTTKEVFESFND